MALQPTPGVKKGLMVFYVLCGILVLSDLLDAMGLTDFRHAENQLDGVPGFYAIYGFIGCVVLVLVATQMRKIVMRDERYYLDRETQQKEVRGE